MAMTMDPPIAGNPPPPPAPAPPTRSPSGSGARPFKVVLLAVGAIITLVMIANGTYWIVSSVAHTTESADVHYGGDIRRVIVQGSHGELRMRGTDRADVAGRRTISRGLQSPSITERVDGDTLTLASSCPAVGARCGVSYTIDVPRSAAVDIDHAAGSIQLGEIDGDVKLDTGAGEAYLYGLAGSIKVDAGAGSIRGANLRSKTVDIEGGAGEAHLDFSTSPDRVSAHLGAGELEIVVPGDGTAYRVQTDEGFGDARVSVPTDPRSPRTIRAETSAGSIRIATR